MKYGAFLLFFGMLCLSSQLGSNKIDKEIKYLHTPEELGFFQERRNQLLQKLPENSCAVFFSSPEHIKSNDIKYKYDPNRNLYYLTGYNEPGGALFLFKNEINFQGKRTHEVLFVQRSNPEDRIWEGYVMGANNAKIVLDFPVVFHSDSLLETELFFKNLKTIFVDVPAEIGFDNTDKRDDLVSVYRHFKRKLSGHNLEQKKFEVNEWMSGLREIKDKNELDKMKKASHLTEAAFSELMTQIHPGMMEFEAEAIIYNEIRKQGGQKLAFPSICGGGNNACILHYSSNEDTLRGGDLILVDIGAQSGYYCSDMTRTFPVNGRFSETQKQLYTVVLNAHKQARGKCKPGEKFKAPHDAAVQAIAQGLLGLGIIKSYSEVYDYYMHGTSHYVGLDVHDPGLYGALKPGQVMTIEPGVYIPEGAACDKKWWGIGIRIEDVLLITDTGNQNLTGEIPIEIADIEKRMNSRP